MKIAIYSADPGNHKFIQPIIDRWNQDGIETQLYNNWTVDESADIYWFDFCDNNLIVATRENKEDLKKKKVIARLHAVEYYMGFHNQIDWSCVDELIFVSEHLKRLCAVGGVRQHVIPNGIDLDKYAFKKRENGYTLGYAGNIVQTKGILTMFHYLREVRRISPYELKMVGLNRFAGREGEYYRYYTQGLPINESGEVENMSEWLEGIDYLWQPSYAESFSIIVGEALSKGIKVAINDFYGARELWPNELIYRDFSEFRAIIEGSYESEKYREFVKKYSLDEEMNKINKILYADRNIQKG